MWLSGNSGQPLYMDDWVCRLDAILQMNGRELLDHAGKISHKMALEKVNLEYSKYKKEEAKIEVEKSLKEIEKDIKQLESK